MLLKVDTVSQLGLVKIIQAINIQAPKLRYPDVFRDEIGKYKLKGDQSNFIVTTILDSWHKEIEKLHFILDLRWKKKFANSWSRT